jgi:hypothetical protein
VLAGLALAGLAACTGTSRTPYFHDLPPMVTTDIGQAGVRDLRGAYRAALCAVLQAQAGPDCNAVLTRMAGEPAVPAAPATDVAGLAQRFRVVVVPGLLAECLPPAERPFAEAIRTLRAQGFTVHELMTGGRAGIASNAARVARELAALPADDRPLVVFGYSKGFAEAVEMAVASPPPPGTIAAIVGVAGVVNGSALAERFASLYEATAMRWPVEGCAPGSGDELRDLRKDVRTIWWRAHRERIGAPLYSLVALPTPERVSPLLAFNHAALSRIDPRNDGQLVWSDAVAAPGALLGYVNADHWGIGMRLSRVLPALSGLIQDDVPHAAILQAALAVVADDLARRQAAPAAPAAMSTTAAPAAR